VLSRWLSLLALVGCSYRPPAATENGSPSPSNDSTAADAEVTDGEVPDSETIVPILIDRGLVARYFMDEAASGQLPSSLTDSAGSPQALPITYGQATFVETNGHRGLSFPAISSTGMAEISLGGTKFITELAPKRTVTIEIVAQIATAGAAGSESQLAGLRGGNPDFMLTALGANDLRFFRPFGSEGATWANANTQQRMVLHLVFDSTRATESERIELFKNGSALTKTTSSPPVLNRTVGLGGGDKLMIGNSPGQNRSIQGTIFYVAYYNEALDATEIANNATRLLANDDL
jgi:hypothetical protein